MTRSPFGRVVNDPIEELAPLLGESRAARFLGEMDQRLGEGVQLRANLSLQDAKKSLRNARKRLKELESDRADHVKNNYIMGVKAVDEELPEVSDLIAVLEKWISTHKPQLKSDSRWKKKKITIPVGRGKTKSMMAMVIGVWAVHGTRPVRVTHIPTGLLVATAEKQERTRNNVERLLKAEPALLDLQTKDDLMRHAQSLKGWASEVGR